MSKVKKYETTQKVEIALHFDRTMHCEYTVFLPGLEGQEDRKSEKWCQPFILCPNQTLTLVSTSHIQHEHWIHVQQYLQIFQKINKEKKTFHKNKI